MPYFLDKIIHKPPQIVVTYHNLMLYSPLTEMRLDTNLFYFRFYMNILSFLLFSLSCFGMAAEIGKNKRNTYHVHVICLL